jgi:hypothetical protein
MFNIGSSSTLEAGDGQGSGKQLGDSAAYTQVRLLARLSRHFLIQFDDRHTYMPKVQVNFAGPSYFGGKNNELVLCAGKGKL